MDRLILYSDKKENLKYNLSLEGCTPKNTTTKLCLEFNEGYNLYFMGDIDEQGNCVINIDALKEFEGLGQAKIEVIAENTYFKIHEMPFEVKKMVDVKINEKINEDDIELEVQNKKLTVGIKFTGAEPPLKKEKITESKVEEKVEKKIEKKATGIIKFGDF